MLCCARTEPKGWGAANAGADASGVHKLGKVMTLHDVEVVNGEKEGGGKFSLALKQQRGKTRKVRRTTTTTRFKALRNWVPRLCDDDKR